MTANGLISKIELDGLSPDEAFTILGNDVRLDILQALWDAGAHHQFDDVEATAKAITFSELQQAVDVRDNGQFNYHLSKLIPHFVRHTEEGYRLSGAGKKVLRSVIAISGERDPDVSNELESECPICGGELAAAYEDQWLRVVCTECDVNFGESAPDGTIFHSPLPAGGLANRTAEEALSTGVYRCVLDLTYLMRGICRECAGPIISSVSVCEAHEPVGEQPCQQCGTPFPAWGHLQCETCRFAKRLPIEICSLALSPVISFLYERDIDLLAPSVHELEEIIESRLRATVALNPLRVHVTANANDAELTITLDDELTVISRSVTEA